MKIKKILALVLAVVLLVGGTVLGTLAWLVSQTAPVVNTFTVGDVQITLDEEDVDGSKTQTTTEGRDMANEYHLMPGSTYTKDPTVWVQPGSEPCIVFVKVENGLEGFEAPSDEDNDVYTIADQMKAYGWVLLEEEGIWYNEMVVDAYEATEAQSVFVFDYFTIKGETTPEQLAALENAEIRVTAYAIQAENFVEFNTDTGNYADVSSTVAANAWEQSGFGTSAGADATT